MAEQRVHIISPCQSSPGHSAAVAFHVLVHCTVLVGDDCSASATAFIALVGLIVFGYPGFMCAVFGRFTWKPEPDLEDDSDEFTELDEMDTGAG